MRSLCKLPVSNINVGANGVTTTIPNFPNFSAFGMEIMKPSISLHFDNFGFVKLVLAVGQTDDKKKSIRRDVTANCEH